MILRDKIYRHFNFNNNKFEFKDAVTKKNYELTNFHIKEVQKDKFGRYIKFESSYNPYIELGDINITEIKGIAYSIKIDVQDDETMRSIFSSTKITQLVKTNKFSYFSTLLPDGNKIKSKFEYKDVNNEYLVVYLDLTNKKIYINNKDVTSELQISWGYDDVKFRIGTTYYTSFYGNLYNFSIFNDELTKDEITKLFQFNNYLYSSQFLIEKGGKYYSVLPSYYNNDTDSFNECTEDFNNNGFYIGSLVNPISINDKNIIPIKKFKGKINLIEKIKNI